MGELHEGTACVCMYVYVCVCVCVCVCARACVLYFSLKVMTVF